MPLPLFSPNTSLLRFRLVYAGVPRPVFPGVDSDLTLTREPGEQQEAGAFYYRDKLQGSLTFAGADYQLLLAIERSTARCEPLGLEIQHRGNPRLGWETWRGSFTCNDISFNLALCTATVAPDSADPYTKLLQAWDKQYNILLTNPGVRRTVTAQLARLASGISIEFQRVRRENLSDFLGEEGWTMFLENKSWIPDNRTFTFSDGDYEQNDIIFRYRLRDVPMNRDSTGRFVPIDKSAAGWAELPRSRDEVNGKTDYVREPGIAGFKTYKIGTYSNWNDPRNPDAVPKYGDQLLLIDASLSASDYGYDDSDYIDVTGPDGYGANNAECVDKLRVRRYRDDDQCSKLLWKFGSFTFGQCFPLLDALYCLLEQTLIPVGAVSLIPPTPAQLSDFLSQPVNQATGETGAANELPRLLISAGSDVKRYGASEPATRLLISLKELTADMRALWDAGWFVDPATGWFRFEHRAWLESQPGAGPVRFVDLDEAILPNSYGYRDEQLPRYEQLSISNAATEDLGNAAYFALSSLDYGLGACVNQREGQNTATTTVNRLTGDVAAGVLNGDQLPDSCLFILAPDGNGQLPNANRELAANNLLYRYYRRGRVAASATIEPPAPLLAPNTVSGPLPVTGVPALIESVRPPRTQTGISVTLCAFNSLAATAEYVTNLSDKASLAKAVLNLTTREVKADVYLPALADLTAPPDAGGKQFSQQFPDQFD